MDYKNIIVEMRLLKQLKGRKPSIIKLEKKEKNKKYLNHRWYVASFDEKGLHFQGLSRIFHKNKPKFNFFISYKEIKSIIVKKEKISDYISIYLKEEDFLNFYYFKNLSGMIDNQLNFEGILNEIETRGITIEVIELK